tara:strand:+ start:2501 stop:2773 length:273 start_codon:yes stop_codon:yes gene_type:complete
MSTDFSIKRLKQRAQLKEDLHTILQTPEGERFFRSFLRECHVTKPVFHSDDNKLRECEGRRRLAMSYLDLLSEDDPHKLIRKLEEQKENE